MNIYFAGSITGGREKQKDYFELIEYCKQYGNVLTEHIGTNDTKMKDQPKLSDNEDENVYLKDTNWLNQSDIVIADITIPSTGVGYEIGYAEKLNIPILCLYDNNGTKKLTSMIAGNKNIITKTYKNIEEAKEIIKEFIESK